MAEMIKVGATIPQGTFTYVAYTPKLDDHSTCGLPQELSTDEWKGKKVVLLSVPGAFTPTCHVNHLPPYLERYDEFKAKGVDVIAVLASNDVFVMSAWGRVENLQDKILALSDYNAEWSEKLGLSWNVPMLSHGATRTKRYALIIDDLVVKYAEVEPGRDVTVSGAEAVLAAL